ncbi:protein SOB FIVE-LIKE 5-like isoform X2 [Salvia hispanica]|uniref:protein SOB FIVE-LIKE 5-like isoform X2 n=1 Tax=Salvia hispanica TaxID=49212 RepID=UPI00200907CE|nr:protein SOB FIVE-LIKE 5-like isoform X2 [Salvia hispanica]
MNYIFENQECSSGCESGWTLYFQQSYKTEDDSPEPRTKRSTEEDDEDLSMLSDASSGPPQVHEEEGSCYDNYATLSQPSSERKKKRANRCRKKVPERSSLLDDTASSSLYGYCNKTRRQASVENVVEYSQGYSSTQFEVRPTYVEEHYDFLQSGNQQLLQQNQWFEGKMW